MWLPFLAPWPARNHFTARLSVFYTTANNVLIPFYFPQTGVEWLWLIDFLTLPPFRRV